MVGSGLVKLIEECGELSQVAAKKLAYFDVDEHPDGAGSMKCRLEEEIADVLAACAFVIEKFYLDQDGIQARSELKLDRYKRWDLDSKC